MPIKFPCPHCKKAITAADQLTGKRVACPACKQPLTVPAAKPAAVPTVKAGAPRATAGGPPKPLPPRPRPDAEAEAAAALADEAAATAAEPTTIDFNCPFCETELHLPLELGGKQAQCTNAECRRLIKVPMPAKQDAQNWRTKGQHLPSAARRDDQPAPEGAWGSDTRTSVSHEALDEAGVLPDRRPPVPLRTRIIQGSLAVAGLAVVAIGVLWFSRQRANQAEEASIKDLVAALGGEIGKKMGREAVASGHAAAGLFYLRRNTPEGIADVKGQYEKALSSLLAPPGRLEDAERDCVLAEIAVAQVELGGDQTEIEEGLRLKWDDVQKAVRAALSGITNDDARRDAYRVVCRRLIERGQGERALALAGQVFGGRGPAEKADGFVVAAIQLHNGKQADLAKKATDQALQPYNAEKDRPPVLAGVVALAMAQQLKPPAAKGAGPEKDQERIGLAEGHVRAGQQAIAQQRAAELAYAPLRLRACVGMLDAALDREPTDTAGVEPAVKIAAAEINRVAASPERITLASDVPWLCLRLVRRGTEAGASEDVFKPLTEALAKLPDNRFPPGGVQLRGRVQLTLLLARLASQKSGVEEKEAESVDPRTPAHALARLAVARHNARYDRSSITAVQAWPEPGRTFGLLGASLATQDGR